MHSPMKTDAKVNWTPAERAAWVGADKETISALLLAQEARRRLKYLEARVQLILGFLGIKDPATPAPEGPERGLSSA